MYPTITNEELEARLTDDVVILDVREREDFAERHIHAAVNLPIGELTEQYTILPAEKQIYVICYLGGRSQIAAEFLRTQGYQVTNVSGGMNNWQAETVASLEE